MAWYVCRAFSLYAPHTPVLHLEMYSLLLLGELWTIRRAVFSLMCFGVLFLFYSLCFPLGFFYSIHLAGSWLPPAAPAYQSRVRQHRRKKKLPESREETARAWETFHRELSPSLLLHFYILVVERDSCLNFYSLWYCIIFIDGFECQCLQHLHLL